MSDRRRAFSMDDAVALRSPRSEAGDEEEEEEDADQIDVSSDVEVGSPREDFAGVLDSYVLLEGDVSSPTTTTATALTSGGLMAASSVNIVDQLSVVSSTRTDRMTQLFNRHQTVEVLPRSQGSDQVTFQKPRPNSELYRTYTSSVPLNARLRQRLLDEEVAESSGVVPSETLMTRPLIRDTTDRAADASGSGGNLRRVPSLGSGLVRSESWRVFYGNLPRALRFRQNTRSTTRHLARSNAASLRDRVRAQREQASKEILLSDDEVAVPFTGISTPQARPQLDHQRSNYEEVSTPLARPQLGRQRSNFEDVAKYTDSEPAASTPHVAAPVVGVDRTVSYNDDGRYGSINFAGRTSSVYSVESHVVRGKTKHKIVKINPDGHRRTALNAAEDTESGEPYFSSNEVKTSQYSWWSFVPVFLYLTFQKTANLYFLVIGIFQMIPDISPTDGVPLQFLPLAIVTIIDAVFAGYEDYKRHIADDRANSAPTQVFNRELREFEDVQWRDVQVGDFVKIANHETIPADVLILAVVPAEGTRSGGNTGVCYVETKNLDGETNLKLREAPRATRRMFEAEEDAGEVLQGCLESEMPNGDINRYSGTLYIEENESITAGRSSLKQVSGDMDEEGRIGIPITLKNMLLRGSKLRNTSFVYGLVVNTGVDSKIMMSSGDEFPVKLSSIDEMTNKQVIMVVILLVAMSLFGAIGDHKWLGNRPLPSEVDPDDIPRNIIGTFVYFFTTLASMVPITLYVSITMVKALQAFFMERDINMYDAENDVPMVARNMQLNEQLGQISHVFSDKTGTLTCNKMEFRKCSIFGKSYGKGTTAIGLAARLRNDYKETPVEVSSEGEEDDAYMGCPAPNVNFKDKALWNDLAAGNEQAIKIRAFFTHLALCHGVLIERLDAQAEDMEMPPIVYSASSPDEQALVSGAKYFGFEFVHREPGSVSIKTPEGTIDQYEILEVFEFDSTRKRMTVVLQKRKTDEELMQMNEDDDDDVFILCKGADSVLFPRLANSAGNDSVREPTLTHMENFARDGLRTLVICSKVMKLKQWEEFHLRYRKVCADLLEVEAKTKGEPNAIDDLQEEMERDLDLLGATAIEDRLQDGVPETMEKLAKAGICIWVLTGDMEETAINIGFACRLLNNDMQRHVINAATYHMKGSILRRLDKIFHWIHGGTRIDDEDEGDGNSTHAETNAGEHALVIDGASLNLVLEDPLYNLHLLRAALLCKVVIACRVSPQQKAQLVELVKLNVKDSHTLSIGDGANDVPMIQSAHIGIGISGQEGMQAVNSSDYALGQFRYLSPLLLSHGRWNYNRVAALTVYTFYKNIVYCVSMFWYCIQPSAYSGTMIYSAFIQQGYNLFFTALPIVIFAVFDRDLPKDVVMEYPVLYHPATRKRKMFSYTMFWKWIGLGVLDSIGVYLFSLAAAANVMRLGDSVEFTVLQSVAWTVLCVVVNTRFCLMVNSWDVPEVTGMVLSIAAIYAFQLAVDMITWSSPDYDTYSFPWIFERPQYWLGPLLAVVAIFAKEFFYEGYRRRFRPDYIDLVKEKLYLANEETSLEDGDDLKKYSPPMESYMRPELVNMIDYRERRVQERVPVRYAPQGRPHLYRGFAFDQPAHIVNWILSTGNGGVGTSTSGPFRSKSINPAVRHAILESEDPVIFENERYQPFCGYGSTYPGYLLPTDRSRWSDRSGKTSAMVIPLAGLELNPDAPGCDEDGWVYEVDFKAFPSSPPPDGSPAEAPTSSRRSRPPSTKKPIGPLRGFVRRREWVLTEKYKELLRKREAVTLAAQQANL